MLFYYVFFAFHLSQLSLSKEASLVSPPVDVVFQIPWSELDPMRLSVRALERPRFAQEWLLNSC
jgi:hypothetical protein